MKPTTSVVNNGTLTALYHITSTEEKELVRNMWRNTTAIITYLKIQDKYYAQVVTPITDKRGASR